MYSPCCPPVVTNPCTTVNTVPCPGGNPCSTQLISCEQVIYSGPNLPCTQIKNCDTLCVALQKIDEQICDLNSEILILQQVLNNCCNTTSTTTTVLPSTTTSTSTSSSTSTTSTSRTSSTTSTSSSTTSTTSSTSSTSSSTTTSTTTLCPCVDDIIINVTVPGLFTYNDCCNVSKEIEFLTTGERAVTDSNCIRFSTFAAVAPAAFTLVSRGDCCTPSCTTTSTSSTSSSTSTTSSTSSTSSTTSTTSSTSSTSSTSTTTSTSSSTSTTTSTSSTSSTTTTSTSSSTTTSTTTEVPPTTSTTTSTSSSTSTTTSTTTGIPPSCFCYTIENTTEVTLNYDYTICLGGEAAVTTLGPGLSISVCSSTYPTGDDGIVVTGGTLPCTSDIDCIGTTTTTTSSSSTTTSTTAVPPDCNCYSVENLSAIQPFAPFGIDCNGVELPPVPPEQTIYVCSYTTPGVIPPAPLIVTLIGNCSACPTTTTTTTVCTCVDSITFTAGTSGTISYNDCLGDPHNFNVPDAGTYTITDTVNCINRYSLSGIIFESIDSYGPCCTPPPTTTTTSTSSTSSTTTSTTTCISPCYNTEYSITGSGTAEWFDCNASSPTTLFVSGGIQSFCNDGSGVVFYGGATGTPTGNQSICGCNEPIPTTTTTSTSSSTTTTSTTLSPG